MALRSRLEPKVAEIERLADEMYGLRLRANGVKVDGDGNIVHDPEGLSPGHPVDYHQEQQLYDEFVSTRDMVIARFELYYYLDSLDVTRIVGELGGMGSTPGGYERYGSPYAAFDRIHHADSRWLRPVLGMIDAEEWSGESAQTFYDNFLLPFRGAAEWQMGCIKILGMAAKAAAEGIDNVEEDLVAIADGAIAALNGEARGGAGGPFTAVSFIAGAVGLFLPTGASQVAGVVSLGAGVASLFAGTDDSGEEREWEVSGPNAPMILESVWDRLMELEGIVEDKDRQMSDALEGDLESPDAFASANLTLPEPQIDGSGGFGRHQVDTVVPGVPISQDETVVTIVHLYEAGHRNLPSAAYQYDEAASHLTDALPESFTRLFFRTSSTFRQARATVRVAITGTRGYLNDSGEALVDISKNYDLSDEESAEVLRQIENVEPVLEDWHHGPY